MSLLRPLELRRLSLAAQGLILPSSVSGLTVWLNYTDVSTLFQGTGGSTPVTLNGQRVRSARNVASGSPTYWNDPGSASAPFFAEGAVNGRSTVRKENNCGLVSPSAASAYVGASSKTLMTVLQFVGTPDNTATVYNNTHLIGDGRAGYHGIYLKGADVLGYNWDGADKAQVAPIPSARLVLQMRHTGTTLQVRANLGSWASTAAGATTNLTSAFNTRAMSAGSGGFVAYTLHDIAFNTVLSDYDADALAEWGMLELGL